MFLSTVAFAYSTRLFGVFVLAPTAIAVNATGYAIVSNVAAVRLGTLVVGHINDRSSEAEHLIHRYAWHLRELVPTTARPTA